jgi:hypothetical protein
MMLRKMVYLICHDCCAEHDVEGALWRKGTARGLITAERIERRRRWEEVEEEWKEGGIEVGRARDRTSMRC